jgi:hypothetical protein
MRQPAAIRTLTIAMSAAATGASAQACSSR